MNTVAGLEDGIPLGFFLGRPSPLKICVACGRFDGFWEEGLHAWDVAAGLIILEEAGGKISYYDGSKFSVYKPPVCASNGSLHSQMLEVLNLTK